MTVPAGLVFRDVSIRYGARTAVTRATFAAPRGAITALVGPSGSGKTSLLHAVNRLHELDAAVVVTGEIRAGDDDVTRLDPYTLRLRVGLIFQRPTPFPMSIVENVRFPLRAHGVARSQLSDRAEAALRRAALWDEVKDRLDAPATALSGGQQQRLCLARALALEPAVLLLDEPCASLDPRSTALVEETLRSLAGTTTLLLVTHNLAQARRLAHHCACLWPSPEGGRIVDEGPAERVFAEPAHAPLRDYFAGLTG
ncbi:MAG: ATP-binding cassette domain-containing protein [Myxococcota bacterium]